MSKYLTVILGLAAMACGVWGVIVTWPLLWRAIQATIPALFALGGVLAVGIGMSEIRDSLGREDQKTEELKN